MFEQKKLYILNFLLPLIIFAVLILYYIANEIASPDIKIANGCGQSYAKFIREIDRSNRKLSFCDKWNKNIETLTSNYFTPEKYITFDYIGFPNDENLSIYFEDRYTNKFKIENLEHKSETWSNKVISLPNNLQGKVRLVAVDNSVGTIGWLGIGNIKINNYKETHKIIIYIKTMFLILLFALAISILYGYYLRDNSSLNAYIYMSLSVGISAYIAFYAYLVSLNLGYFVSTSGLIFLFYAFLKIKRENYKSISFIFVFIVSMLMAIFFIAYSDFPKLMHMASVSADKWHHFPVDNWLPKIFAGAILSENIQSPMVGDWLSSDRPPLQTGLFLLVGSVCPTDIVYLVTSVGAQLLVVGFAVLLLRDIIKDTKFVFFMSIMLFFNGTVFVNGLNVWPKLFSALYQGIAFYYLYEIWFSKTRTRQYILFGIAAALAFLAHGGSIFYLLGLAVLLLFALQRKEEMISLMYGLVSALLLYIPWVIYQKFIDPPGDRLLKWHLANQHVITDKSFLTVLIDYYRNLTFSDWIDLRISHLDRIFHTMYLDITHIFSVPILRLRDNIFFSMDYSFLFFSTFFLVLYWFVKISNEETRHFTRLILLSYFSYLMLWVLILTSGTVLHQGAYFGWFSGFIGIALVIYYFNRYIFYAFGILNLILFSKIYIIEYLFHKDIISSSIFILSAFTFILTLYQLIQDNRELE